MNTINHDIDGLILQLNHAWTPEGRSPKRRTQDPAAIAALSSNFNNTKIIPCILEKLIWALSSPYIGDCVTLLWFLKAEIATPQALVALNEAKAQETDNIVKGRITTCWRRD